MKKIILKASDYARFIILLAATSNLPKITISRTYKKMNTPDLGAFAHDTVHFTGDADATAPPVSDGTLQAKATSLLTDYGTWLKTKDPALEKQIKRKRNDLILQLDKDADYLQGVARDVAVAAGDVTAGEAVVIRIGFTLKKKSPSHPRDFEFLKAEKGSFHVRVKSASKGRSTYVYEYGITTDEDIMPAKWEKPVSLPVTELIVSGLKAGTIIGVRYTVVLPPSHTKKTAAKMSATTDKNATILTTNKAKKVTVTHGTELYNFSEILYIAIQ